MTIDRDGRKERGTEAERPTSRLTEKEKEREIVNVLIGSESQIVLQ